MTMTDRRRSASRLGLSVVFLLLLFVGLSYSGRPVVGDDGVRTDKVLVNKGQRKLYLMHEGKILKWYWIALGRNPVGAKTQRGDGRTPEGTYYVVNRNAHSTFYRSLTLSYPNQKDRQQALQAKQDPGRGIEIHALPDGFEPTGPGARMIDWTEGCIAVTNEDMDEIWARVNIGTTVEIRP
jgi:murein L,D-transpeptidase YafK